MYGVLANINAIENREVLLNEEFQPNVEAILNAVDNNTKIIFCVRLTTQQEILSQMHR